MTRLFLLLALLLCWAPAATADLEFPALTPDGVSARAVAGKLIIGGHAVRMTSADYQRYIKYLTVPPNRRRHPSFNSTSVKLIQALECPLRRQIFTAMFRNRADRFTFATLKRAQENFDMRMAAVNFMFNMEPTRASGMDFDYAVGVVRQDADREHWVRLSKFSYKTRKGTTATESIDGIVHRRYRGECLGAMQLNVLHAARVALGRSRFNALHPQGLDIGEKARSANKHIETAKSTRLLDMVPGDWVYMKNKDDYNKGLRPGVPVGYWQGENAMYLGRCELSARRMPVFAARATPRFSGMGAYAKSEAELRGLLKHAYLTLMRPPYTYHRHTIHDSDIRWFQVLRLKTGA